MKIRATGANAHSMGQRTFEKDGSDLYPQIDSVDDIDFVQDDLILIDKVKEVVQLASDVMGSLDSLDGTPEDLDSRVGRIAVKGQSVNGRVADAIANTRNKSLQAKFFDEGGPSTVKLHGGRFVAEQDGTRYEIANYRSSVVVNATRMEE